MLDVKRSSSHSKLLQRILARVDHELKIFLLNSGIFLECCLELLEGSWDLLVERARD